VFLTIIYCTSFLIIQADNKLINRSYSNILSSCFVQFFTFFLSRFPSIYAKITRCLFEEKPINSYRKQGSWSGPCRSWNFSSLYITYAFRVPFSQRSRICKSLFKNHAVDIGFSSRILPMKCFQKSAQQTIRYFSASDLNPVLISQENTRMKKTIFMRKGRIQAPQFTACNRIDFIKIFIIHDDKKNRQNVSGSLNEKPRTLFLSKIQIYQPDITRLAYKYYKS